MATLTTYSFKQIVQNFTAAAQAACAQLLDFSVGSINLALGQAGAAVALWLQALALQVLALTRAATSQGSDLDSWFADFFFFRLPAVAATGQVTFARAATTQVATIPVGTIVQTGDGTEQFAVAGDPAQPAYNAGLNAYVIPIGTGSILATVQATTLGSGGNVQAGTVTQLTGAISGVDSVTNGAPFTNGLDAETDAAFRARFPLFLAGLASADLAAIQSAIASVQQGLQYVIVENFDYPGTAVDNGSMFVVVDDGSGAPPSTLLALIGNAINAVRAATVRFQGAFAPTLVVPAVVLNIRVASGFMAGAVEAAVLAAVVAAVNTTPLNAMTLFISAIEQAALSVAGCAAVQPGATTINAAAADLTLTKVQRPRIGGANVTVGTY